MNTSSSKFSKHLEKASFSNFFVGCKKIVNFKKIFYFLFYYDWYV